MSLLIENYVPVVKDAGGFNTNLPAVFGAGVTFAVAPTFNGGQARVVVDSGLVGGTVVITAAQSGGVFINSSTSGTPSWTLPAATTPGLHYSFITANTTNGFTITGAQVIHFKTSASGTVLTSTTTLTNTQGTAIVGDTISLVSNGTAWYMTAISGIFAAS